MSKRCEYCGGEDGWTIFFAFVVACSLAWGFGYDAGVEHAWRKAREHFGVKLY